MELNQARSISLAMLLLLVACEREPPAPPAHAHFTTVGVVANVHTADQDTEVRAIVAMLDRHYELAFLRPGAWARGFPRRALEDFTEEGRAEAVTDERALGLSDLAKSARQIVPKKQKITKLAVYGEADTTIVALDLEFSATGRALEKKRDVRIDQTASLWLVKQADGYRLLAYDVHLRANLVKVKKASALAAELKRSYPAHSLKLAAEKTVVIGRTEKAQWRPELGQPLWILALGSDTRAGPPVGDRGRCDAIHLIGINPTTRKGVILDIPRDSYMNIAGHGSNRINTACFFGGPQLMVQTVHRLTGILPAYYVLTEFTHFMAAVNELGGVDVVIPYAMRDPVGSGANFQAGPAHLDGGASLQFNRNRHSTPAGDFSRTENQGTFLLASLAKFRTESSDPGKLFNYIRVARDHTDMGIPLLDLVKMGWLALQIDPKDVANVVVPGRSGSAGAASVVFLSPGDTFDRVRDDATY